MLGLCFCVRAFSSCGKQGPLFIAVRGPLTIAASLVVEHRLQTRRLSNCGSRAQLLCSMWYLPRPGLEPVSPALAGRFSTTVPPGKPLFDVLMNRFFKNLFPFSLCFVVERVFYVGNHKMITSGLLPFSWNKAKHNFMYYFKKNLSFLWPMWCSKSKVFDFLQWLGKKKIRIKKNI